MSRLHITAANELSIELAQGNSFPIHPLWLRERCQDPKSLDLRTLASFVERLPLPAAQLQMLNDLSPSGQLQDF